MNTEISKVVAEMRHAAGNGGASEGECCEWRKRIERALQQPASADVEREARELYSAEDIAFRLRNLSRIMAGGDGTLPIEAPVWKRIEELADHVAALRKPQQEAPVAYISEEMLARMRTDEIAGTMAHSRPEYCAYGTPVAVYTAPKPRIDLAQFKADVPRYTVKVERDGNAWASHASKSVGGEWCRWTDIEKAIFYTALIAEQEGK